MKVNPKGYILCPKCKKQTKTRVRKDTSIKNFPLWCAWCHKEYIVSMPEPSSQSST